MAVQKRAVARRRRAPARAVLAQGRRRGRDVLEGGGHLPFQVLDGSAIEWIRGLAGESSSIYSCIQIYKGPRAQGRGRGRDVLEGGGEGGGMRGGGGGVGGWLGPSLLPKSPYGLRRRGAKKAESSGCRRRRGKFLPISLKHWKGRKGGGKGGLAVVKRRAIRPPPQPHRGYTDVRVPSLKRCPLHPPPQ